MINMNVLMCFVIGLYMSLDYHIVRVRADKRKVKGMSGVVDNEAKLPCMLDPVAQGDSPKLILWYKRGLTKPVYSHDGRSTADPIKNIRERGHITILKGTTTLSISHVITSDAGMYECRVDFFYSPSQNSFVNFTVIEPPTFLEIEDHDGNVPKDGRIGPYLQGDSVKIICLCRDGNPSPNLTWYRNSHIYDEVYEVTGPGLVINELNISNITRDWDNNTLRCTATNSELVKQPLYETVQISMYLLPTSVKISAPEEAYEGEQIRLHCSSRGSHPSARLSWSIAGLDKESQKENTQFGGAVSSTLLLNVTRDHHSKTVTCKSHNPNFPEKSISNTTILNILYPPKVTLNLGKNLQPSLIKEGDDVYFTCEVNANPKATTISWYHEDKRQDHVPSEGIILSGNSLVLQKVNQKRAGTYHCEAKNTLGNQTSNPLQLKIRYKPKCQTALTTHFIYDQPINVTCSVSGFPTVNSMMWRWNSSNDVIKLPARRQSGTSDQSFSVFSVKPSQNGKDRELSCWGVNKQGIQMAPCKLSIKTATAPPAPLSSCRLANITGSSLKLTCKRPNFMSAEPSLYRAEVYLNKTLFANVQSEKPSFYIKGLDPGTTYIIHVYTTYGKITSSPVLVSAYTSSSSDTRILETRQEEDSYNGMTTVLWIAGILVTGTVIIIIFICKQVKAQQRNSIHKEDSPITISDEQNPDVVPHVETYDLLATTEPTSDKIKYEVRPCISNESTHIGSQSNSRSAYSPRTSPHSQIIDCHIDSAYVPMFRKPEEDRIAESSRSSKCDTYCPVDRLLHQAEESVV